MSRSTFVCAANGVQNKNEYTETKANKKCILKMMQTDMGTFKQTYIRT